MWNIYVFYWRDWTTRNFFGEVSGKTALSTITTWASISAFAVFWKHFSASLLLPSILIKSIVPLLPSLTQLNVFSQWWEQYQHTCKSDDFPNALKNITIHACIHFIMVEISATQVIWLKYVNNSRNVEIEIDPLSISFALNVPTLS